MGGLSNSSALARSARFARKLELSRIDPVAGWRAAQAAYFQLGDGEALAGFALARMAGDEPVVLEDLDSAVVDKRFNCRSGKAGRKPPVRS